ncbi:hypothetical protein L7F22_031058 [Adiantum nelumboides]|nr:hypothetical protein [Adiantum nelumboides]
MQYTCNAVIIFFPSRMSFAQDVAQWVVLLLKRQVVCGVFFQDRGLYEILPVDADARNKISQMSPLFYGTQMVHAPPWSLMKNYQSLIHHKCPVWVELMDFACTWKHSQTGLASNTNGFCILWDTDVATPTGIVLNSGDPVIGKRPFKLKQGKFAGSFLDAVNLDICNQNVLNPICNHPRLQSCKNKLKSHFAKTSSNPT